MGYISCSPSRVSALRRPSALALVVSSLCMLALLLAPVGCGGGRESESVEVKTGWTESLSSSVAPAASATSPSAGTASGSTAAAPAPVAFDVDSAMSHVAYLADTIGPREEGSEAESAAARYIEGRLREYGYSPAEQAVPIPVAGLTSRNVVARLGGGARTDYVLVVGAHMDTKSRTGPCPGANDNGTGCGVLLELARVLAHNRETSPSIEFVFFGGEEISPGGSSADHHFGSSRYAAGIADPGRVCGMISVDMVGFGETFVARNMQRAPQALVDMILTWGTGFGLSYLQDTASTGLSDHEPFENLGIPSAWIEWRDDPATHGPGDDYAHVDFQKVLSAGMLMQSFLEQYLNDERVDILVQSR